MLTETRFLMLALGCLALGMTTFLVAVSVAILVRLF